MSHKPFMYAAGKSDSPVVPCEGPEQRGPTLGGGAGGKRADRGERRRVPRGPHTEAEGRVPEARRRAASVQPSSEIGAVCGKAARTDLCGGCPATGIPTATREPILRDSGWQTTEHTRLARDLRTEESVLGKPGGLRHPDLCHRLLAFTARVRRRPAPAFGRASRRCHRRSVCHGSGRSR